MVNIERIYLHIREDKSKGRDLYKYTQHHLKHRKRGLHKKRSKIVKKRSIEKCLAILNQNTEFDHWKIDLMVEGR